MVILTHVLQSSYMSPPIHTHIALALGVMKLFLVSVYHHFLHHSTATPHVKHCFSVLVSYFLHDTNKDVCSVKLYLT